MHNAQMRCLEILSVVSDNFMAKIYVRIYMGYGYMSQLYTDTFLNCRICNGKPTRARVGMMPIGTPRVPYRTPGEGTWQWVDLWNALVSYYG